MASKSPKKSAPKRAKSASPAALYDQIQARSNAHILAASRAGRDISPAPEIADRARRDAASASLRFFLETYFPRTFRLAWSADHLAVIDRLESAITSGGQYALAMPRASGKSSLTERACLWAILTGRRKFVAIVAGNESLAEQSLDRLKAELEFNSLLLADWPKAVYPIKRLESQARRAVGQLYQGQRTAIVWRSKQLVMPTMPGPDNEASGASIAVAGLTGALRGLSRLDASGATIRPDLFLVDDPQTRESAASVTQTAERLQILNGEILGLSGPEGRSAAVVTATVIYKNDLADQILDRERNPAWHGERYQLVYAWPDRADLWEQYAVLRKEGMRPGGDKNADTAFYAANRAEMDRGSRLGWEERHEPGELSALQNAYNLRIDRGEDIFASEYQNQPVEHVRDLDALDPAAIANRCGGFARGVSPPEVEKITAMVDVGGSLLWWVVCGWAEDFSCFVLDYGCHPEQRQKVFLSRNADPTLEQRYPQSGGGEGAVYRGLDALVGKLMTRPWQRSDGATLPLSRLMVDAGWNTDLIRLFVRQSPHRDKLTPSKGVGIGPGQAAIADWHKRPGEKLGDGWILGAAGKDHLRLLRFDSNHWKSRVGGMLQRPMGIKGGVTLFGDKPSDHDLLGTHLSSEYPVKTEAKGNAVNVWTRRPDRENHMFDCLIGCAVSASLEGFSPLSVIGGGPRPEPARKRVSMAAMQHQAQMKRGYRPPSWGSSW